MLAAIKHAVAAIFFFQQHRASEHNAWFVQHSSAAAVQSLISSTAMAPANQRWTQMSTVQDLWSHTASSIWLQVSNIEEINQQLAEVRQTINAAFERHGFHVFVFLQVEQRH